MTNGAALAGKSTDGDASATTSTTAATDLAAATLKRYTDDAESLRQRFDVAAKIVAALGSTLVTAIGIAKFSDLFPFPPESPNVSWLGWLPDWQWLRDLTTVGLATAAVIGGYALMVLSVLAVAWRFWKVHQPIPLRSDVDRLEFKGDWRDKDRKLVLATYDEVAELNDVESLRAYEARAHRLERIAKWLPKEDAERVNAEAVLIQTEVLATQTQARIRILRRRVTNAVRGPGAIFLYLVFAAAFTSFAIGADYLSSERTDKIAVAKACADARAVDSELDLPSICGSPSAGSADQAATPPEIADAKRTLAASLQRCLEAAIKDSSLDAETCDQLVEAISALHP